MKLNMFSSDSTSTNTSTTYDQRLLADGNQGIAVSNSDVGGINVLDGGAINSAFSSNTSVLEDALANSKDIFKLAVDYGAEQAKNASALLSSSAQMTAQGFQSFSQSLEDLKQNDSKALLETIKPIATTGLFIWLGVKIAQIVWGDKK